MKKSSEQTEASENADELRNCSIADLKLLRINIFNLRT